MVASVIVVPTRSQKLKLYLAEDMVQEAWLRASTMPTSAASRCHSQWATCIRQAVCTITDMNTQIACAAEQQSSVAEEISRNVEAVNQVVSALSDQAEQSSAVSQQLNHLAVGQQTLLGRFKV